LLAGKKEGRTGGGHPVRPNIVLTGEGEKDDENQKSRDVVCRSFLRT